MIGEKPASRSTLLEMIPMKLDVDEHCDDFGCSDLLVTAPEPDATWPWRCQFETVPAPVAPKLRDAILGLPRDNTLRHAYLRKRWSLAACA
jgi:hypothetical protein